MTEKKLTIVERFEIIKSKLTDIEDIEFIESRIEIAQKKNTNKSKVDKNVGLRNEIFNILVENEKPMSCSDVVRAFNYEYNGQVLTTQKVSPQLKKLVEENMVIETIEKKIKVYSVAE